MLSRLVVMFALLSGAQAGWAEQKDPCSRTSSVSDVQFTISTKDGRTVFEEGEIIPLVLSFTSTTKGR